MNIYILINLIIVATIYYFLDLGITPILTYLLGTLVGALWWNNRKEVKKENE